jgi:hypothetical protein
MLKYSEGLRNALMVTGPLRTLLTGGEIHIYSGPVPASPNDSIGSAVKLVTINAAGSGVNFESTATGGTLVKSTSETWSGTAIADGAATFFRFVMPSDSEGVSSTAYRIQGTVAVAGADMNLTNPNIVTGAAQALDYFYLTMPEQ